MAAELRGALGGAVEGEEVGGPRAGVAPDYVEEGFVVAIVLVFAIGDYPGGVEASGEDGEGGDVAGEAQDGFVRKGRGEEGAEGGDDVDGEGDGPLFREGDEAVAGVGEWVGIFGGDECGDSGGELAEVVEGGFARIAAGGEPDHPSGEEG